MCRIHWNVTNALPCQASSSCGSAFIHHYHEVLNIYLISSKWEVKRTYWLFPTMAYEKNGERMFIEHISNIFYDQACAEC